MRERERESAREKLRERENMKKMIESEVMMFGYEKQSFKVKQKSPGNSIGSGSGSFPDPVSWPQKSE